VTAGRKVGIINIDAHLDVRPPLGERGELGHSGSPFRQALEHPSGALAGRHYVCLGAQPQAISREHLHYVQERGGRVLWADDVRGRLAAVFALELERLASEGCVVYVTLDADVADMAEVPGVSAPNPAGLVGTGIRECARLAGRHHAVASFDLVEINPLHDRDSQSARWAALVVWHFLMGLARRRGE
jgi:arginase family enzyme